MPVAGYDEMGLGYGRVRRPDPRLGERIWSALGDARSVVNIGAGTGSYEPPDREVLAIEPSAVMIAQRPVGAPPALQAKAESLPLADKSFDAALAVLSIQHWDDVERGLSELVRVARERLVLVTIAVEALADMWLVRDYAPETLKVHASAFPSLDRLLTTLPGARTEVLQVPRDCSDGFAAALWARPEAFLDPSIRAASSVWHQLPPDVVERTVSALARDLQTGRWDARYGVLREKPTLDVGLRLVVMDL